MKAVLLVGGEGTRLRPITLHRPKSMVPLVNRPFLEYQLALLKRHGVREAVLSSCHLPGTIRRRFGTGAAYGLRLHYAVEKKPLGTAGAVKFASRKLGRESTLLVLNGDILTDMDLGKLTAFHRRLRADLTLGLSKVPEPSGYGVVRVKTSGAVRQCT